MRTFRRTLLDDALTSNLHLFTGRVLDVGGKKVRKRGLFRPDAAPASSWEYLNIDPETDPDFLAPADAIPVADEQFDSALLAETLQHLEDPASVLREIARVVKPGGRLVATMPFLFPLHFDPDDFGRWTPSKFRLELGRAGFDVEEVSPMGSVAAVLFDLCWIAWSDSVVQRLPVVLQRFATAPFALVKPVVAAVDARLGRLRDRINTGYFVVARRASTTS
jgi:SAM-dependent methyltransferase